MDSRWRLVPTFVLAKRQIRLDRPSCTGVAWGLLPLVWPLEGGTILIANFLDDRGP
jgi:hypothetical protein